MHDGQKLGIAIGVAVLGVVGLSIWNQIDKRQTIVRQNESLHQRIADHAGAHLSELTFIPEPNCGHLPSLSDAWLQCEDIIGRNFNNDYYRAWANAYTLAQDGECSISRHEEALDVYITCTKDEDNGSVGVAYRNWVRDGVSHLEVVYIDE